MQTKRFRNANLKSAVDGVVRGFLRDLNVVRMAFRQPRAGNLDELAVLAQVVDVLRTAVAHAGADAANHLINGICERSLIRHTALDAFRNVLLVVCLEVAVAGALTHSAQRAHAAVDLELSALIELVLAGGLLAACNKGAEHNNACACCERLDDITAVLDAAVCDNRNAVFCRRAGGAFPCKVEAPCVA